MRLQHGIAERGTAYLVVSGGSTPIHLFSILADADVEWGRVVVLLADERWVPVDHEDSNERLVRETLLTAKAHQAQFVSLLPTPEDEIANIAGLSTLLGALPRFDMVLLGMGEDAHTASLFPGTEAPTITDHWATVGRGKGLDRITLTAPVLSAARQVIFLVSGAGKQEALRRLVDPSESSERTPARLVQPASDVLILADQDATASL